MIEFIMAFGRHLVDCGTEAIFGKLLDGRRLEHSWSTFV